MTDDGRNSWGSLNSPRSSVLRHRTAAVILGTMLFWNTAAPALTKLTPKEIQDAFFNGQPFISSTPSNIKFRMTFTADGKMTREPVSRAAGIKGEGTWHLSKDGFCTSWKGSRPTCFTLVNVEENKWSVVRGATTVATWSKEK